MASMLNLFPLCLSFSLSAGARRCPGRQVQVCAVIPEAQSDAGLKSPNRYVAAGGSHGRLFQLRGRSSCGSTLAVRGRARSRSSLDSASSTRPDLGSNQAQCGAWMGISSILKSRASISPRTVSMDVPSCNRRNIRLVATAGVDSLVAAYTGRSSKADAASAGGVPRRMLTSSPVRRISTSAASCFDILPRIA